MSRRVLLLVSAILAQLSFACGSSDESGEDDPSPTPPTSHGDRIFWDDSGRITMSDNAFGIRGKWYVFDDCADALPDECTAWSPELSGPDGRPGWSVTEDAVCARGVGVRVTPLGDGSTRYERQFGAVLGFGLDERGDALGPYDAESHAVRGFGFTLTGTPFAARGIRGSVRTKSGGPHGYFKEYPVPSESATLSFAPLNLEQGGWVEAQVPFSSHDLERVEFHVYTGPDSETPFDFCVSDVRVLQ